MVLQALDFETEYRSGECNLIDEFYRPCLENSVDYDRAVGYFRSSIVIVYGRAIISFARKGGKIRLVCSTDVTPDDVKAAEEGAGSKKEFLTPSLLRELESLLGNPECENRLRAVATLVAIGTLDLRIAYPAQSKGMFHEKLGVFIDKDNDAVSFKGSSNETWSGWHPLGNIESNEVFCSWQSDSEALRVKKHRDYFERLWEGHIPAIRVVPLPEAVREKLLTHRESSLDDLERRLSNHQQPKQQIQPHPHQEQALQSWEAAGRVGILEHATGSGKTITALLAIRRHFDSKCPALVLVPSQLLVGQWLKEAQKVLGKTIILPAGAGHTSWREGTRLRSMTANNHFEESRLVIATMHTTCTQEFRAKISGGDHLFLVADEVHQIGSPELSNAMKIASGPRLGLSATPVRFGDPDGTERIKRYFGEILEPPFSLRDAMNSKVLCEYRYFPHVVSLSEEEAEDWRRLSVQIGREIARNDDSAGPFRLSDRAKLLLIRRSRIAKKAVSKIGLALEVIETNYKKGQRWLIYCEDLDQLNEIVDQLRAFLPECSEYHSQMAADRQATLEWFENSGGVLVSIACLDEGVDIPAASHALILASSQNPRQFIQRRGRVLRKSPGKYIADIHDALVAPISIEDQPQQASLLEAEFARAMRFAADALNPSSIVKLRRTAAMVGVDPDSLMNLGIED